MTGLADGMATAGNKKMFPLTHNSVRVIAGTESFESNVDHINKNRHHTASGGKQSCHDKAVQGY